VQALSRPSGCVVAGFVLQNMRTSTLAVAITLNRKIFRLAESAMTSVTPGEDAGFIAHCETQRQVFV
jgi:hypothetical protein